jgi:transposase
MGDITMNIRDTRRIAVLDKLMEKSIKQRAAAQSLGVSVRQIRRLLRRYKTWGASGVIHKLRGLPSNHQADEKILDQALDTIRSKYPDFSVTLAHEKLVAHHAFPYSRETLREAMIATGMWSPKRQSKLVVHAIRQRRTMEGELVQIDGSPYDWFEGRAKYCSLLVFIDDATGKLKYLQFVPHETTVGYMRGMEVYIDKNDKPRSLYSDRHGIFRVNSQRKGSASVSDEINLTQFGRTMKELSIELIFTNSPQAKGRVERVNQTLQDRLPKEMRLRGINTWEAGNRYLPQFMEEFNQQFGVVPASFNKANIPLSRHENLAEILVQKDTRIISKTLTISYEPTYPNHATQRNGWPCTRSHSGRSMAGHEWEDHPPPRGNNPRIYCGGDNSYRTHCGQQTTQRSGRPAPTKSPINLRS